MSAISELNNYKKSPIVDISNKTLDEANALIKDVKGDMLNIRLEVENINSQSFGIYVRQNPDDSERTAFIYDTRTSTIGINTGLSGSQNISGYFKGDIPLIDNAISMDIFLDRSQVEAFFNEQLAISARIYPTDTNSKGISLYSSGGDVRIKRLVISEMKSIHS